MLRLTTITICTVERMYFMGKIFLDTGAWVALFVANDINHKRATAVFDAIKESKDLLYTSDYVLDETITTVLVRGNHKQSILAGQAILTSKIVKIVYVNPDYLRSTWDLYQKYNDKKFSFTDVSSLSIMKNLGITKAFAFDRELSQAGIELI